MALENSPGFVVVMSVVAKYFTKYTHDHADVHLCGDCGNEFRWKGYEDGKPVFCFYCGSTDHKLIRKMSEY